MAAALKYKNKQNAITQPAAELPISLARRESPETIQQLPKSSSE